MDRKRIYRRAGNKKPPSISAVFPHTVKRQYEAGDSSPLSSQNPNWFQIESSVIFGLCVPATAASVDGEPLAFALASRPPGNVAATAMPAARIEKSMTKATTSATLFIVRSFSQLSSTVTLLY